MNELNDILTNENRAEAFIDLVSLFMDSTEETKKYISMNWPFDKKWKYPNSFKLRNETDIKASLCYYLIDEDSIKHRESLIDLCAIYHSAKILGFNQDQIFIDIAKFANENVATFLISFINRKEEDKSLESFRIKLKSEDNTFELIPPWDQ